LFKKRLEIKDKKKKEERGMKGIEERKRKEKRKTEDRNTSLFD